MIKLILVLLVLASCATSLNRNYNQFEFVIRLLKTNDHKVLAKRHGNPSKVTKDKDGILEVYETKNKDENRFQVYWNLNRSKIKSVQVFLWGNFDNYEYLKKYLGQYQWVEEKVNKNTNVHHIGDFRRVTIPDINASFEYQADAPYRKSLYIYFGE